MLTFIEVLAGFPYQTPEFFPVDAYSTFRGHLSLDLGLPLETEDTLVGSVQLHGWTGRFDDPDFRATTSHLTLELGWRHTHAPRDTPESLTRFYRQLSVGADLGAIRIQPDIWQNYGAWGLSMDAKGGVQWGQGPWHPTLAVQGGLTLSGAVAHYTIDVMSSAQYWTWFPTSARLVFLIGAEHRSHTEI